MIDDLRANHEPVHVYEKTRITVDGRLHANVPGSSPIDLPSGATSRFATLVDAASKQGLLSTFGFISQIVYRTEPFLAVDPDTYLDLTMYPQAFILLEAFGQQPVAYRNTPIALHRTATQAHKLTEAIGRREERFMAGGPARLSQYFGTTLAAAWQRSIDHGAVDRTTISQLPERLLTRLTMVDWIRHNRAIDPDFDRSLDRHVVEDAQRFFREAPTRILA